MLIIQLKQQVVYNKSMFPAVFLDRDGVIIENRADYVRDWSQVVLFPDTIPVLSKLRNTDYKIVLVTNQSAIGRGLISIETADNINQKLIRVIESDGARIDGVYMCPHAPEDHCDCRKPSSGLFFQAARELSLNLGASWMIGDAWSDLLAGQGANLRGGILVKTGRGASQLQQPIPENLKNYFISDNLSEALDIINNQGDF